MVRIGEYLHAAGLRADNMTSRQLCQCGNKGLMCYMTYVDSHVLVIITYHVDYGEVVQAFRWSATNTTSVLMKCIPSNLLGN